MLYINSLRLIIRQKTLSSGLNCHLDVGTFWLNFLLCFTDSYVTFLYI